ncbi:MAG: PaaI family thioesterase [Pseudomonadota bacterium]
MSAGELNAEVRAKVEQSFAAQALMKTFQARVSHLAPGACEITAPILPAATQQQGFAHAGLTFSLGDSAAGYAALTLIALESEVVTAEMKINLLAPATGQALVASGRVLKPGRRLIVAQSDVYSLEGESRTHVATLLGTMVPVPRN